MKKSSKNAKWNGLTPMQRDRLESWLFDERMSYPDALALAKREFGFAGSVASLRRFYHRTAETRLLTDAVEEVVERKPSLSEGEARAASLKAVGNLLMRQIAENPDEIKEWWMLARLLLQSQENELRERLQAEENEIRREYLGLARERFHWNAVDAAEKALPEVQALAQKRKDPKVRDFERNAFRNALRRKMFGSVPGPAPESEEHKAELEEFEKQRKLMSREEFGRYALVKIREMRARGDHEEVIARRVDAAVVNAARWEEEEEKRLKSEGQSLKSEAEGEKGEPKEERGNIQHSTRNTQRLSEGGEGGSENDECRMTNGQPSKGGNGDVSTTGDTDEHG